MEPSDAPRRPTGLRRMLFRLPLSEEEAVEAMTGYARRHPRAARGLSRFMGFRVDGSEVDYREVGRRVPMLRLDPSVV